MGWRRLAAFLMVFLSIFFCNAQKEDRSSAEEIYLFFNVPVYGGTDIPAVLKDNSLFLPVNVIFDFLRINQQVKPGLDSISGFFLSEHTHYLIDRPNHCIILNEQKFITGESDFIRTESNLFLKTDWFGKVFGLECAFDYTLHH